MYVEVNVIDITSAYSCMCIVTWLATMFLYLILYLVVVVIIVLG